MMMVMAVCKGFCWGMSKISKGGNKYAKIQKGVTNIKEGNGTFLSTISFLSSNLMEKIIHNPEILFADT